jgi:hypothetical protein
MESAHHMVVWAGLSEFAKRRKEVVRFAVHRVLSTRWLKR